MGAKTKELPLIKTLLPTFTGRVIEPFAGSAAVSFDLERETVLNDCNRDIINLYQTVQDPKLFSDLQQELQYLYPITDNAILEKEFYDKRKTLNKKDYSDPVKMAVAYLVTRQLCHRGMQRENSKGEFNIPFGHGRIFQTQLSNQHHDFLNQKTQIMQGDFEKCISLSTQNDWIFIDPPYYDRKEYSVTTSAFSEDDHKRLAAALINSPAKWLIIHPACDLYSQLYANYTIEEEDFRYNIHFGKKGTNRNHAKVKHLYIRNY